MIEILLTIILLPLAIFGAFVTGAMIIGFFKLLEVEKKMVK